MVRNKQNSLQHIEVKKNFIDTHCFLQSIQFNNCIQTVDFPLTLLDTPGKATLHFNFT